MKKKRRPNVAKTLINNWISALFCAIEIHNKPKIEYRYPNVVILLLNAWELILKAYIYKILKNKKILNLIIDLDWNGRYIWLNKCINLVFWSDKDNQLFVKSIELLYEYRNIITHAFSDDLDELIYSIITENIILFWKFLKDNFWIDLASYNDNLILLPIWIKKPFNPIDFLSNESYVKNASHEVKEFLSSIKNKGEELQNAWIEDWLLVTFDMEIVWKYKVKNVDFTTKIDNNSEIWFSKETTLRITNDQSAQPMRPMSLDELREEFSIDWYYELKKIFNENYSNDHNDFIKIYRKLKEESNYNILWINDPESKKIRFTKNINSFFNNEFNWE